MPRLTDLLSTFGLRGAPAPEEDSAAARPPVPRELLRQVRRIELRTRRLVNSLFSGEYHSVFKGQGIEFAEVREYLPGDDVRTIDWNVTARLGQPYVKKFVEERELTVLLAVDLSGSQRWGTRVRFKSELVAEVAAALAMAAIRNNDRVGLLLFSDRIEAFVPPRKGRRHVLRLIRDLLVFQPAGQGTDLAVPLDYAVRALRSRAILFLFSDFQIDDAMPRFERALSLAATRHDIVAVNVADPGDTEIPDLGLVQLRDPESGELVVVDTGRAEVRGRFEVRVAEERAKIRRLFRRLNVDEIELRTDVPYANALLGFFRRREQRRQR
ncbi:MAG TPA: DUF58 domain-containing protein [Longimicrobiaceae bacterium]|nr:DUF58 domain-containing protein [Longimicrobiaceae bacterium]